MNQKVWFPAKKYGFGWGLPNTWQGWAVLLAYVLLIITGNMFLTAAPGHTVWLLPYNLILTLFMVLICWKKGEKAAWRWGNRK